MQMTKHEGVRFENQTIYISGQAFIRCQFVGCTVILRETIYHLEDCVFERCNWHVDVVLMWGSAEMLEQLKGLINLLEQAQQQQAEASETTQLADAARRAQLGSPASGAGGAEPPAPQSPPGRSPFA